MDNIVWLIKFNHTLSVKNGRQIAALILKIMCILATQKKMELRVSDHENVHIRYNKQSSYDSVQLVLEAAESTFMHIIRTQKPINPSS